MGVGGDGLLVDGARRRVVAVAEVDQVGSGIDAEGALGSAVAREAHGGVARPVVDVEGTHVGDTRTTHPGGEVARAHTTAHVLYLHLEGEVAVGGNRGVERGQHKVEGHKVVVAEGTSFFATGEGNGVVAAGTGRNEVGGVGLVVADVEHALELLAVGGGDADLLDVAHIGGGVEELQAHDAGQRMEVEVVGHAAGTLIPMAAIPGHHGEHLAGEGDVVAQGLHGGKLYLGAEVLRLRATRNDIVLAVGEESQEILRRPGEFRDECAVEVGVVGSAGVGQRGHYLTARLVGSQADIVAHLPVDPLFVNQINFGVVVGIQVLDGGVELERAGPLFLLLAGSHKEGREQDRHDYESFSHDDS